MPTARSRVSLATLARGAVAFAALALLLAGCGDGGAQAARDGGGGSGVDSAEVAELELALATLEARLTRLEDAVEELTALVGGDASLLGDLPELMAELRLNSALFEVAFERLAALEAPEEEDPCDTIGVPYCPENPLRDPRDEQ